MARVYTDPQHYTDIASAIRYKNGTTTQYKPEDMAAAIRAIGTIAAFIKATFTAGNECTCSDGTTTLTGGTSGSFVFAVPNTGTWTVTDTVASEAVSISEYGQRNEIDLT